MVEFSFGGDTGQTYGDLQRRRKILSALAQARAAKGAPRTIGQGIASLGGGLQQYLLGRGLAGEERTAEQTANEDFQALIGGGTTVPGDASGAAAPGVGAVAASSAATPATGTAGDLSPRVQQLAGMLSNPYLPAAQRQIVSALLQKEMTPKKFASASAGSSIYDPSTGEVTGNVPAAPSTAQPRVTYTKLSPKQANAMQLPPGGSYQLGSDGKVSQIGTQSTAPGRVTYTKLSPQQANAMQLPPGGSYQLGSDGKVSQIGTQSTAPGVAQGNIVNYDETGTPISVSTLPGSSEELKREEAGTKKEAAEKAKSTSAQDVSNTIDRAIKLTTEAVLPVTGAAGVGRFLSKIDGTTAADVAGLVKTIKANVGFDALQEMRENSPTGGSLGNVSNYEVETLQALVANLEQSQSEEQFLYNLNLTKDVLNRAIHKGLEEPLPSTDAVGTNTPAGASEIFRMPDGTTVRRLN